MKTLKHAGFTLKNRSGRKYDWFINVNHRVRWGSLDEVKADAEHAQAFGYLPAAEKGWA